MAERYCGNPKCVSCIHAPTVPAPPDVDQHARSVVNDDPVGQAAVKGDRGQGVSSMPRCATCKHWGSPKDQNQTERGCYKVAEHLPLSRLPLGPGLLFASTDDEITTRADFGCVEHEAKDG